MSQVVFSRPIRASSRLLFLGVICGGLFLGGCQQNQDGVVHRRIKDLNPDDVYVVVEKKPDCGGTEAVQETVEPPTNTWPWTTTEGRVFVQFVVTKKGEVVNAKVTRGVSEPLNKAALRAVQRLGCEPGMERGEPVHVQMSLPVAFQAE